MKTAHTGQNPSKNQLFYIIQKFFDRNDSYIILNQNFKIVVLGAGSTNFFRNFVLEMPLNILDKISMGVILWVSYWLNNNLMVSDGSTIQHRSATQGIAHAKTIYSTKWHRVTTRAQPRSLSYCWVFRIYLSLAQWLCIHFQAKLSIIE